MAYLDDAAAQEELWEEKVPWMYLDTDGNVTVGIGQMLPNLDAAQALRFGLPPFGVGLAQEQQIADDFFRVKAMEPGMIASRYLSTLSPRLPDAEIERVLSTSLTFVDDELAKLYVNYADAPYPAKLAAMDLGYNLGITRLRDEFPHLNAAFERGDWHECAAQCHRKGISLARNNWTQGQFNAASMAQVTA